MKFHVQWCGKIGLLLVVVLFTALSIWGYQQKAHIASLTKELNETEQERLRYVNIIQKQQLPSPTPTPIKDFFTSAYKSKPTTNDEKFNLKCVTGKQLDKLANLVDVKEEVVVGCQNMELKQWVLLVKQRDVEALYSNLYFYKLYLASNDLPLQKIYSSESEHVECKRDVYWYKSLGIVFSCRHVASGGKGDFSNGAFGLKAYDLTTNKIHAVERCNPTILSTNTFEGQATGPLACVSLCQSDADCRENHFCDSTNGVCIRECSSYKECVYPFDFTCGVYKNHNQNDNHTDIDVRLGCGLGEQYNGW